MKYFLPISMVVLFLSGGAGFLEGAPATTTQNVPPPTAFGIVASDANSRVWERTVYEVDPKGTVVARKHRVTELASGLNFWRNGQWQSSKEEIDLLPAGGDFAAAATNGQCQAWFPMDIQQGVIQLSTPDGRQIVSRPVGLFFEDDNHSVLIAVLTNSVGGLVGANEVIYPNAFEGATASLRYKYTLGGFEQDVVVQGQLPDPAALGLVPARTRLGVLTAFFDTNNPVETPAPADPQDGLSDPTLTVGTMQLAPGRAFVIGDTNQNGFPNGGTRTYKHWLNLNGHKFLMEEVPYPRVAPQLEQLPLTGRAATIATNLFAANSILNKLAAGSLPSPSRVLTSEIGNRKSEMTRLAQTDWDQQRGFVLDYVALNTSLTNYVFQGDSTYEISGNVTLAGTNYFEGGAVVKFARGYGITVAANAVANWLGSAYRPVVFTAVNDPTVGELIGSSPSGYYAIAALSFSGATIAPISNLRIAYAQVGLLTSSGSASPVLYDVQFVNCIYAAQFSGGTAKLRNVLFANVQTNFVNLSASGVDAQNATFNNVISLSTVASGSPVLFLTNCILAGVTNNGTAAVAGGDNGFYNSTAFGAAQYTTGVSPFQTVGAGNFYLTASNSFRNAGTTNIDPAVLADIAARTTYRPLVYSNVVFTNTTWAPGVQRDTDTPDLGYHYAPIDYAVGDVTISGTLTLANNVVVAAFPVSQTYGLRAYP